MDFNVGRVVYCVVEILRICLVMVFVVCACIWNYVLVYEWIKFIRRFVF